MKTPGWFIVLAIVAFIALPGWWTQAQEEEVSPSGDLKPTVLKTYDIRDLIVMVPNFTSAPTLPERLIKESERNTGEGGGGGSGMFSPYDDEDDYDHTLYYGHTEAIMEMIRMFVGNPEDWAFYGGEQSVVIEQNGQLLIRTSEELQQEVVKLLEDIRAHRKVTISLEAWTIRISTKDVAELRDKLNVDGLSMTRTDAKAFRDEILKKPKDIQVIATGRTLAHSGQRVYVYAAQSGGAAPPSKTGSSYDASILGGRDALAGNVVDVVATASADQSQIIATVRWQAEYAAGGTDKDQPVRPATTIAPTTLRIPEDGAIILSGAMNTLPFGDTDVAMETVLFLQARIESK